MIRSENGCYWHIASFRCYATTRRLSRQSEFRRGVNPADLSAHDLVFAAHCTPRYDDAKNALARATACSVWIKSSQQEAAFPCPNQTGSFA